MKKFDILLVIVEAVSALVLIIFAAALNFHTGYLKIIPFGLSRNYIVISARYMRPIEDKELKKLKKNFINISGKYKSTIILDNNEAAGLGLYDTKGTYSKYYLKSGNCFNDDDFKNGTSDILVQNGSFADECYKKNNIFYSSGNGLHVKRILNKTNPLLKQGHQYVYSLISADNLEGDYYIDSENASLVSDIKKLFDSSGFETSISYPERGNISFIKLLMWLNSNQQYFGLMLTGTIIVYFNFFMFFIYYLLRQKKAVEIHMRLGATKFKLFLHYIKSIFPCCISGSLSGTALYELIYYMLQKPGYMKASIASLTYIIIIHSLLTILTCTIVFYIKINSGRKDVPVKNDSASVCP